MAVSFGDGSVFYDTHAQALADVAAGNGILTGVGATASGGLVIQVGSGCWWASGTYAKNEASSWITLAAAGSADRVDLLYANSGGAIGSVTGTPSTYPSYPDIPVGGIPVAAVAVGSNVSSVAAGNITDLRFMSLNPCVFSFTTGSVLVLSGTNYTTIGSAFVFANLLPTAYIAHTAIQYAPANTTIQAQVLFSGTNVFAVGSSSTNTAGVLQMFTHAVRSNYSILDSPANATWTETTSIGSIYQNNALVVDPTAPQLLKVNVKTTTGSYYAVDMKIFRV